MAYESWLIGCGREKFAQLSWSVGELQEYTGLGEKEALEFLQEFGDEIADTAQDAGNKVIKILLRKRGLILTDELDVWLEEREISALERLRQEGEILKLLFFGGVLLSELFETSTLSKSDVLRTLGRLTRRGLVHETGESYYRLDDMVYSYARRHLPDLGRKLMRKVRRG